MARVSKKKAKELASPDQFQSSFIDIYQWAGNNQKVLVAMVVVVMLVAVGVAVSQEMRKKKEAEASNALFKAEKLAPSAALNTPAVAGDDKKANEKVDSNPSAYLAELEKVTKDFPNTGAGSHAALLLGNHHYDLGDYAKAADHYKVALDWAPSRKLKASYTLSVAQAHEAAGNWEEAEKFYRLTVDQKIPMFTPEALLSLGQGFYANGKALEGKIFLDQLINGEYPGEYVQAAKETMETGGI